MKTPTPRNFITIKRVLITVLLLCLCAYLLQTILSLTARQAFLEGKTDHFVDYDGLTGGSSQK